ncbi:flagellar motor protein [Bdellovibrionota bacterium FG-1]
MIDLVSVLGAFLGLVVIAGGVLFEGLHATDVLAGTAAVIVFGGTLAATLLSFPSEELGRAWALLPLAFQKVDQDVSGLVSEIVEVAALARKEGVLAIEAQKALIKDPVLQKNIKYVIDGFDPATVREILDHEIETDLGQDRAGALVWETAGGYAPTVGIIGAVLGLIHVMRSLDNPSQIGGGVAVAFVATVYGMALANLILLPVGSNLRRKAEQRIMRKEVVKAGVVGIQEGLNPHFLQQRLEGYIHEA